MKRIGFFGRFSRGEVTAIMAKHIVDLEGRHKVETYDFDAQLPESLELDLAVIFGGDGTILRAARYLAPLNIPAIGVNLGKFGFLAGCVESDCPLLAEAVLEGKIEPTERTMLVGQIQNTGRTVAELSALNDIVVTAAVPAQMVAIELAINKGPLTTIQGDGLIVSTATGSTGYNLSCGGPIVAPSEDVIILTALAPHTLAIRPMVISGGDVVDMKVSARRTAVSVTADGQVARTIKDGDSVCVRRAPYRFRLYEGPEWSFYKVVRGKLRWGEEVNYAKDQG